MLPSKTFFIKTYGCQMNVYDSQAIEGLLMEHEYAPVASESEADVILLNTCSVRDLAEQKVLGKAGILAKLKKKKPDLVLGVCGCMAQNMKDDLFKRIPLLDLVCGPNDILGLPKMIEEARNGKRHQLQVENPRWVINSEIPKRRESGATAWLSVMRGCNHNCTFCIVPRVRGREVSRSPEDIVNEAHHLVRENFKEVTLLGQNINSYGRDLRAGANFPKLLALLNDVPGLERIRFMTSHPVDIRDALIEAMADLEKVCEFLHFPIQSGSNRILELMKRGYTRQQYIEKVEKARKQIPGVAISTDLIVGFPGETEEDFMDTCRAVEEIGFDGAYIFKYSIRTGTPAAVMAEQIPEEVKEERHRIITGIQDKICLKKNKILEGQILEILTESQDKKNPGRFCGRTRDNRIVYFEGSNQCIGELAQVKIERATAYALYGMSVRS